MRTITRGIKCEIEVEDIKRRSQKFKSRLHSKSSESCDNRDGGRSHNKTPTLCRIPGNIHAWKDFPENWWSRNYKGSASHRCLDRLLEVIGGIRIGMEIEINIHRDRSDRNHRNRYHHGWSDRCRGKTSSFESMKTMILLFSVCTQYL